MFSYESNTEREGQIEYPQSEALKLIELKYIYVGY